MPLVSLSEEIVRSIFHAAALSTVLLACETVPPLQGPSQPVEDTGLQDVDGDGFDESEDCNDFNWTV